MLNGISPSCDYGGPVGGDSQEYRISQSSRDHDVARTPRSRIPSCRSRSVRCRRSLPLRTLDCHTVPGGTTRRLAASEGTPERESNAVTPGTPGDSTPKVSRSDKRTSVDEANKIAKKLTKKDPSFVHGGAREWARRIREATGKTCSVSTVYKTALWKTTMQESGAAEPKEVRPRR